MIQNRMKVALITIFFVFIVNGQDNELEEFETISSRTCRKSCINQYGNFCTDLAFSRGTCCDWEKDDCGGHGGWCANKIDEANRFNGLEYWVCPREAFCGELVHIAQAQPNLGTIKVSSEQYSEDVLCTYKF